jgi:hypothetical protein
MGISKQTATLETVLMEMAGVAASDSKRNRPVLGRR